MLIMKIKSQYVLFLLIIAGIASCKKDNYSPPSSTLQGRLVYNGDSIGVERNQVTYELYQYGFGKVGCHCVYFRSKWYLFFSSF